MFERLSTEVNLGIQNAKDRSLKRKTNRWDDLCLLWGILAVPESSLRRGLFRANVPIDGLIESINNQLSQSSEKTRLATTPDFDKSVRDMLMKISATVPNNEPISTIDFFDGIRRFGSTATKTLLKRFGMSSKVIASVRASVRKDERERAGLTMRQKEDFHKQFKAWEREGKDPTALGFASWAEAIEANRKS